MLKVNNYKALYKLHPLLLLFLFCEPLNPFSLLVVANSLLVTATDLKAMAVITIMEPDIMFNQ